jgi:hypothetical protein
MQAINSAPNLMGRRLVGSALYALLFMGISMPVMIWIAGLAVGPQALREKFLFTPTEFAALYGGTGMLLVILAIFVLVTLYNLVVGARRRYSIPWGFGPLLFDDALSAREKIAAVLASNWCRFLLVCDLGWAAWLVVACFAFR